ncbi:single-stranded DNA-binding protein [Erysipelothrix aquatica]|uniref:single-stranded DNA-binding protein n=1 Tax=Erysipelothrix aquatica TaxID=2683714 RepID=UPI00135BCB4D|nr:single-stranded DNA-binding protein [Erysipelothrix aquatica]
MNEVRLIGRLSKEPKLSKTADNISVCFFNLAVDRPGAKNVTDFIDVMAFDKVAESIGNYKHKGDEVLVYGEIRTYTKEGKNEQGLVTTKVTFLRNKQTATTTDEFDIPKSDTQRKQSFVEKAAGFFK